MENTLSNLLKIEGRGLQLACGGKEGLFHVDCRQVSVKGSLDVMVTDSNLNQIPCIVEEISAGSHIYSVKYVPPYHITRCLIEILYNKITVYDEPFIIPVVSDNEYSIFIKKNLKPSGKACVEMIKS